MKQEDTTLYLDTVHAFLSVYRHLRRYSRRVQEHGLNGRQVSALRYLLEKERCTIGQLRDYLYLGDSSTSELVANLEQRGYVARARSETDNRVVFVTLTPAGRQAAEQAPLGGIPLLRERLKTLPPERLALLKEAMQMVAELLGGTDGC